MKVLASLLFSILLMGTAARADIPSVHGMLVFGGSAATYASHLPMFHAPHDRQVILKIVLMDVPGSQTLALYEGAKNSGKSLFTLEPQVMDLEKVANGTKTEFMAAIYDGHFERGGQKLGDLKVKVENVVFSAKLNGQLPPQQAEKYFVFGKNGQYFAAHVIQGKPSFDAIVEVSQPYVIFISHCHYRVCDDPKKLAIPDDKLPLILGGPNSALALQRYPELAFSAPSGETVDGKTVLYVEEGDLSH
jgi:hypothetical protein